jgi:hypothetical protein
MRGGQVDIVHPTQQNPSHLRLDLFDFLSVFSKGKHPLISRVFVARGGHCPPVHPTWVEMEPEP